MRKIFLLLISIIALFIFLFGSKIIYALPDIAHKEITEMSSDIKYSLKESEDNGLKSTMDNFPKGYEEGFKKPLSSSNVSQDYPPNSLYGAQHYYDPTADRGLYGIFPSAKTRANDLYKGALRVYCFSVPLGLVSPTRPWEVFAESLHLMQDMTTPAHTIMADHAFGDSFEDYVKENWGKWDKDTPEKGKIINPKTGQPYTGLKDYVENYKNEHAYNSSDNSSDYQLSNISKYMDDLAKDSRNLPKDEIEIYTDPQGTVTMIEKVPLTWEQKRRNAEEQLPKALMYGAGLINTFWRDYNSPSGAGTICIRVPEPVDPAGDHPDDRFDVSDEFYWESEFKLTEADLTDLYLRTGLKKGKIGVWYKKQILETLIERQTKYKDSPQEIKDAIELKLYTIKKNLEQRVNPIESDWKGAPDIALFTNGFYNPSISLMLKIGEPVSFQKIDFNPEIVKDHPVLLVPTGGFYGLKNSETVKVRLEEYVKNGGTLVVLTQQHGYDWGLLPTPENPETGERETISGYGYQEDQSCTFNSVYINTYHPVLSVFSNSIASIGVDGYFTSYPESSTVLLRRTANGQPAMILYPYGKGYVIATTLYTDFALTHHQANQAEINFVQNIISWAKKPAQLPEIKPGETVSVSVELRNHIDIDAASVKFSILDPNRKIISEHTQGISIPARQTASVSVSFTPAQSPSLGIYHIDYTLLDSTGTIIQPQAETDSGRFVVSNPPKTGYQGSGITFSVQSDSERYITGSNAIFSLNMWNNTDVERTITARYENQSQAITIAPKSLGRITYSKGVSWTGRLWVYFYDESGKYLGNSFKGYYGVYPSASLTTATEKMLYIKGETGLIDTSVKNNTPASLPLNLKITITDPLNTKVFEDAKTVALSPYGTGSVSTRFTLPTASKIGSYTIRVDAWYGTWFVASTSTRFELPESKISVIPTMPSVFTSGANTIQFTLTNTGKINVSSGALDLSFKNPDGDNVYIGSYVFTLAVGENKTLEVPVTIPSLKFGNYTLTYTQSDETKMGNPTTITIPNTTSLVLSFDKPSYKLRETANLTVDLTNTGKFNLENVSVMVSVPDAGFQERRVIDFPQGQGQNLQYVLPIPEAISAGTHEVQLTITLPSGGSQVRTASLMVPRADVQLTFNRSSCRAGETLTIQYANKGGVDSGGSSQIKLYDRFSKVLFEKVESFNISAGASNELSVTVPEDAVRGSYFLQVELLENWTGQRYVLRKDLDLEGVMASLKVETDKEIYLRSEEKHAIAYITPSAPSSVQGNLNLRALFIKPWFSMENFTGEGRIDPNVTRNMRGLYWGAEISNGYIDLVVCSDGRFTIGTTGGDPKNPADDNAKLLYGHPDPRTSFTTVRIDGMVYLLGKQLLPFKPPYYNESSIITEWQIGRVKVIQQHSIAYSDTGNPDTVKVDYTVRNEDINPHSVGIRVMLDTQLGDNDGAPFQIPNVGNVTMEREFLGDEVPAWLSMNDLTDPTVIGKGILIGLGAVPPDRFVIARWSPIYNTQWDYTIHPDYSVTGDSAVGIWWNPQQVEPGQERKTTTFYGVGSPQVEYVVWETNIPVGLNTSGQRVATMSIPEEMAGKFTLAGTLFSSSGQVLSRSSQPFYVVPANMVLLLHPDKKLYKPGDVVTINGEIRNLLSIGVTNLILEIKRQGLDGLVQTLYSESFDISAGGIRTFAVNTPAEVEGPFIFTGSVIQNNSTLVEIIDQYEVAKPKVSVTVMAPYVVGTDSFSIDLQIKNEGRVEATVNFQSSIDDQIQSIIIPSGEVKLLQYSQQITSDTTYTFTFIGDLEQTVTKTVAYGFVASIAMNPQAVSPEGNVAIPVTITNTGQLAETVEVKFEVSQLSTVSNQQIKSYYLPIGGSTTDTLNFNLTEGDYQLTASSQLPLASAQAGFSVGKENKVEMALSLGAQTDGLIPLNVNLTNSGFNTIEGSIQLSAISSQGTIVWNSDRSVSQLSTHNSQLLTFNINPSAFQPGDYTLKVELLNNNGQSLSIQSSPWKILGPMFVITQVPSYQVFYPGEEATFIFKVKNNGNQEGAFDLNLKAYDLLDSTQREWLKPGEEKAITFGFMLPEDLEEKDYFASYELKDQGPGIKGQIKYHLAGINLSVNASLDKQYYNEGETAHLTINIQSSNPNPQPLFARVNYAGYESQQPFALNRGETILFDIPLTQITGEKLFFGIYHESGRSIHLNSLYIHKAGDVITITTDKQVYNPGGNVSVTVIGNASGNMTLSGPGGYTESFTFSGLATKSFALSFALTAGTYFINAQLEASNPGTVTASHPFDVAGIQVKVLECKNDKGKYVSSDTITTTFSISSNTSMSAILKAWIVDPSGEYNLVSENNINLSSSENSLVTVQSILITSVSGIHRLTYGIFSGDLLLVSGSEVFDVGDAVLLGLSTDRVDYAATNEPVNVKASMYGTVSATLEFFLDGQPAGSLPVSLSGFSNIQYTLSTVTPGMHTLKAILSSGGLTSTKETTFVYGSTLPDLTVYLYRDQAIEKSTLKLTITVMNQGKTDAGPTTLKLYDGMIVSDKLLATLGVKGLASKESQTFTFNLNCLGRSGSNTIYAVIDPNNVVNEFNETNNESQITLTVPEITLSTNLEKEIYPIGEPISITSLITNLLKDPLSNIILTTTVKDVSGLQVFTKPETITSVGGMATITIDTSWLTDQNLPEGLYTIYQTIEGRDVRTQKAITLKLDKDFAITSDVGFWKIETGETGQYNFNLTPLRSFSGEVSLSIQDCPQGFTASFTLNPVSLSGGVVQTILKMIPTGQVRSGSYSMKVSASGGGKNHDLSLSLDLTDFQMVIIPKTQTIKQLEEASYTITLNPFDSFDSFVTLEVVGVPGSMRADLSTSQVTLPRDVTLTLSTSKSLLPGAYDIVVKAKGRVVNHEAIATLIVHKNPLLTSGIVTQIIIDKAKLGANCSSDLIDFPLLIEIEDDAQLRYRSYGGSVENINGYDIIFKDANQNQLAHEVEYYDGSTGRLIAWVKIPTLSISTSTVITMEYGDPGISQPTENQVAVWDSHYKGVYHLNQLPRSDGIIYDSTINALDLTPQSSNFDSNRVEAQVGYGLKFRGWDYLISSKTLRLSNSGKFTIETWVKSSSYWGGRQAMVSIQDGNTHGSRTLTSYDDGPMGVQFYDDVPPPTYQIANGQPHNTWVHLVARYDGTKLEGFVNGKKTNFTWYPGWGPVTGVVTLGVWRGETDWLNWFLTEGCLDEVRISDDARNSCWIQTSYINQSDPFSFYTIGYEPIPH